MNQNCKSCGKSYVNHLGIQGTCAENIKLKEDNVKLFKHLQTAAIDFASQNGTKPEWWIQALKEMESKGQGE